jgi:hypothetical protein
MRGVYPLAEFVYFERARPTSLLPKTTAERLVVVANKKKSFANLDRRQGCASHFRAGLRGLRRS